MAEHPSAKALGYSHSVRSADVKEGLLQQSNLMILVGEAALRSRHSLVQSRLSSKSRSNKFSELSDSCTSQRAPRNVACMSSDAYDSRP